MLTGIMIVVAIELLVIAVQLQGIKSRLRGCLANLQMLVNAEYPSTNFRPDPDPKN